MSLPGTTVTIRETPPARTAPTDTGVSFVAGLSDKGPLAPTKVRSISEFASKEGPWVGYSILYDAIDTYLRVGGAEAYVARVVGGSATASSVTLVGGTANADTLTVSANSPGDWGDKLNAAVLNGGTVVLSGSTVVQFKLQISHDDDGILETSPGLPDKDAAFRWAVKSKYIVLADEASDENPNVVAARSLAGGDDDRDHIVDADWAAALARFTRDLGPGQVWTPGRTSDQAHEDLLAHGATHNRVPLLDFEDTADVATLTAAADAARSDGRFGGGFAPWALVPGIVGGLPRRVPYSAVEAGIIARNDRALGNPNIAAAGENGQAIYATGLSQPAWDEGDREALNDAGVNIARMIRGGVRTYGFRSLADPDADPDWVQLTNARLVMAYVAQSDALGETYVFSQLDGLRRTISRFEHDLAGIALRFYNGGALYGATADEAFRVDTGGDVNTDETIAAGRLRAVVSLKPSPFAERVEIEIVKKLVTEAL